MSFKRIFYDYRQNKIYHWFIDEDGKTKREEFHPKIEYYVADYTKKSQIKDIYGNPVVMETVDNRFLLKDVRGQCQTCETNISEDIKFLQKRYGSKDLKVDLSKFQIATIDIEVQSDKEFPKPEHAKYPINLITVHFSKQDKLFTFGLRPYTGDSNQVKNYIYCADEKILIRNFIKLFRKMKVDIITGWYSRLFDIPYIINRCNKLKIEESLSPVGIYKEKNKEAGYHIDGGGYEIAGISILDGLDLYKNFVYEKEVDYNLNAIGLKVVKEGKLQYEGTINDLWKNDWNKFVEYNIQDVLLTKKIEDKKRHIDLAITLCYQSLVPFEKVFSSVNLVTGSIIKYLHRHNMVLNDFERKKKEEKIPGAFCFARPGSYKYVISFDVTSLYPHMVMMWNISIEKLLKDIEYITDDIQKTPLSEYKTWEVKDGSINVGGIYYKKDTVGVLPAITKEVFDQRIEFKNKQDIADDIEKGESVEKLYQKYDRKLVDDVLKEGFKSSYYDSQQLVRKIWINALYGCMTNEYFPLFSIENGMSVTLAGQELIKYLSSGINDYLKEFWVKVAKNVFNKEVNGNIKEDVILLTDTDSIYLHLDPLINSLGLSFKDNKEFELFALKCEKEFLEPFFKKILQIYADRYKAEQIIKFKRENIITKMIVLAKKKYAIEIINDGKKSYLDKPKIKIKGIEVIKTDTSLFSREYLKKTVDYIFETWNIYRYVDNKELVLKRIAEIKEEFLKQDIHRIAICKGCKEYTKWVKNPMNEYIENGLSYLKGIPIQARAAQNYNYLVEKYQLPLQQIFNGNKVKYVYIFENNEIHQNIIGFMGRFPEFFKDKFEVDYELQWEKSFLSIIQRFFDVLGWGKISLIHTAFDEMEQFCS